MRRVGLAYRRELAHWIETWPAEIGCLEITAEHFFGRGHEQLKKLRKHYPLVMHGLGLSLGTPGKLDQSYLDQYAAVCEAADARWVSEHLAFTKTGDVDLGHLNPIAYTTQTLDVLVDHVREVMDRCGRRLLIENITSHLKIPGSIPETKFLNSLCMKTGCGVLLDVTNLYINSRNHGFDPLDWLADIDASNIVQLHVVGYSEGHGQLEDWHAENIQEEIWQLIQHVVSRVPVEVIIIERDQNYPHIRELVQELRQLEAVCGTY